MKRPIKSFSTCRRHSASAATASCCWGQASVGEVRQVFELPVLKRQVTEHQAMQVQCRCGALHRGQFPADVKASVQYGPGALAGMVYLNQHHMLPVQRTAAVMSELFDLPVAQATVLKACEDAAMHLTPIVGAIAEYLQTVEVLQPMKPACA